MEKQNQLMIHFVAAGLVGLSIVAATWLYTERTRFQMIPAGEGAYKYDRITGDTFYVRIDKYAPVNDTTTFN